MADLRHVWVCAKDLQLVRADRIISISWPATTAAPRAPTGSAGQAPGGVYAEIEGGTDGDFAQKVKLAGAGATTAGEMLGQLASVITTAAAQAPVIAFVYPERERGRGVQWTSGPELPDDWPSAPGAQVTRLRD
jgi:hypothetical protein